MINRERLVNLFCRLVQIDSESFHEREMADCLKQKLDDLGLIVFEDNAGDILAEKTGQSKNERTGTVIGRLPGTVEGEPLMFSAHMDTVGPGNGKIPVINEDGTITSEGETVLGADDLTGVAAIIEMLECIKENDIPHPEIEVVFPVAEEAYAFGSAVMDYDMLNSKYCWVLDSSGPIGKGILAAPSIIALNIEVIGRSAHAGFCPEDGIHSLHAAAKAIAQLPTGHVDEETTINIGTIEAGSGNNIVPWKTTMRGEVRSMNHDSALHWVDVIRITFEEKAGEIGASVNFTFDVRVSAYRVDKDSAPAQKFAKACQQAQVNPFFDISFGGSDNNYFVRNGFEGIVISSGMNRVHTVDEYCVIDDMVKSAEIILNIARG